MLHVLRAQPSHLARPPLRKHIAAAHSTAPDAGLQSATWIIRVQRGSQAVAGIVSA